MVAKVCIFIVLPLFSLTDKDVWNDPFDLSATIMFFGDTDDPDSKLVAVAFVTLRVENRLVFPVILIICFMHGLNNLVNSS